MLLHTSHEGVARNQRFVKVHYKTARTSTFEHNGRNVTVEEYFAQKYNIRLKCPNLPLIQVGKTVKGIYVPMELLKVADKRQRVRSKLPDDLQALTTSYTTVKPLARFNMIRKMMDASLVGNDEFAKAFGVSVDLKFLKVQGRVLPNAQVYERVKIQKPFGQATNVAKLAVVNVNNAVRDQIEVRTKTSVLLEACNRFGLRFGDIIYESLDLRRERDFMSWLNALKVKFK